MEERDTLKHLQTAPESLFWYWIAERHAIWEKRQQGLPKPWTTDPILQNYKFTNPFRKLDAGTVWLHEHFLDSRRDAPLDLIVFNTSWYRQFNWTGTGELLGWQLDWNPETAYTTLTAALADGKQVFTGAHIVWSEPGMSKIEAIVTYASEVWAARHVIASKTTLQTTFDELVKIRGIGGFIGYEIVSDLRHTRMLDKAPDINTWANMGPGALRGLRRLDSSMAPYQGLTRMRELLGRNRENLPIGFPKVELRDIEHSLCEFDKYCRVKFGEGEPRSKYNGR